MIIANLSKQITSIIKKRQFPTWFLFLFFYSTLLITPNNKFMGILVLLTGILLTYKTKNILASLFYLTLLCLPFTKGKGFQFEILHTWQTRLRIPYTFDFDITFWGVSLMTLIYCIVRNRKRIEAVRPTSADICLLLFLLSFVPSTLFSSYPDIAILGFLELSQIVLLYFVTRQLKHQIEIKLVSILIAFQLAFEGALAIVQFILKHPLGISIESSGGQLLQSNSIEYAVEQVGFFRSRGTFDHSNSLGTFAASLVPFFVLLLLYKKNTKFEIFIYSAASILGVAAVILSGSRTSIAVMLVCFLVICLVRIRQNKPLLQWNKTFSRIIVVTGLISLVTIVIPRMFQLASTFQQGGGLTYRTTLLGYAISIARANFFGVGLGLFPKAVFTNIGTFTSYPAQPHNLFAQLAAEGGILALAFFLIFIASKFKKAKDGYLVALIASVSIMLTLSQMYPFLLRSSIFPYMMFFLAILP